MKTHILKQCIVRYTIIALLVISGLVQAPSTLDAQSAVTNVFTHTQNAISSLTYSGTGATGNAGSGLTGNSYTYKFGTNVAASNNITILDSLTAFGLNYHYQPASYLVKFRRVDNASVTGLRKSFRIEQTGGNVPNGGTVSCLPDYNDSLEQVFTQRIFNVGIDNVFQNASTTNNMNVERMDVIFPIAVKATDNTKAGFVVFDWGSGGTHDPFYIAAIKTIDAGGNPTSYYPAVLVSSAVFGSGVGGNAAYVILRKNPGEPRLLLENNSVTQNRDGVFLRFSDLGIPNNINIHGYSLFGTDVVVTPVSNLVDYTNATNFPTGTDMPIGGLDPLAVTGLWVSKSQFIILPDRISDFHATALTSQVKLSWNLISTDNLAEQVVERSDNGIDFTPVTRMQAGLPGIQTTLDTRPLSGKNYYRVKLVEANGAIGAYSTVSLVDMKPESSINLRTYPNPVKNNVLTLDIHGLESNRPYEILLLNMNGSLVFRHSFNGEPSLKTSIHLPGSIVSGSYELQVIDNAGNRVLGKHILVQAAK